MGKFESYPSINSLSDDDISLYNHDTVTHKINFARLAELIKTKVSESIPIQGSNNLVTSGGIYNAIKASADSKADKATTLEGYGITNAYNMVESNIRFVPKYSIDSSGWDNAPTASSTNPVVSGGVYEAIRDATTDMVGATASADGTRGLVPKPLAGDENKVLKGDGTWGDSASSISTLTDVNLTNISDGQLLRYNSTSQKWENIGIDTTPTQNSTNPVSSGGVYTGLSVKAPTNHASTATTYGAGNASNYGHVKLNDSYTSSGGAASASVGASSKAVVDGYNALNGNKTNQSVIAPRQANNIATQKYEVGKQFIYNNILYTATAEIAKNGTINPSGNCSQSEDIVSQIGNLKKNQKGTAVNLWQYNTASNKYTIPNDGYISLTTKGETVPSGDERITADLYDISDNHIGAISCPVNQISYNSNLVFVKAGTKVWCSRERPNTDILYIPLV